MTKIAIVDDNSFNLFTLNSRKKIISKIWDINIIFKEFGRPIKKNNKGENINKYSSLNLNLLIDI